MADCPPVYLLAYDGDHLVARASLWLVRNEPLPKVLGPMRNVAKALLAHWPLLICRSPLAYTSGLALRDDVLRAEVLPIIAKSALTTGREHGASFIVFDYLSKADAHGWPGSFSSMSTSDPGTIMESCWANIEEYLAAGGKKDRQHYKRVLREAEKLGIQTNRHLQVNNIEEVLPLIRNVEINHGALSNPWVRKMLEEMEMIGGSFVTATIGEQLVGCGLLLEDNNSQMTSVLGLAEDIPYVYFMLVYESLKIAFEHNVCLLRWGSGAYDVKQRLGFSLEDNGSLAFAAINPFLQKVIGWLN